MPIVQVMLHAKLILRRFASRFPQVSNRRCVLFLGRIHPKKGLEHILRALPALKRQHPEILLLVAGNGHESYLKCIRQVIHREGLDDDVLFTGMLTGDAKWGAFACSEIFVLPSKQENFAIAMAEAMHMGVPVVISDKVNSWPFVTAANAGVVIEEERLTSSLGQKLDELLSVPGNAEYLGKCGQAFAQEHFTWDKVAKKMVKIYERMLSD